MTVPPLCRYCGKPIGKVTKKVYLVEGPLTHNQLAHNATTTRWSRYLSVGKAPATKSECRRLTKGHVVSVSRGGLFLSPDANRAHDKEVIGEFTEWDGESYRDDKFCSNDHAQRFGYLMADGGHCTKRYNEALVKLEAS